MKAAVPLTLAVLAGIAGCSSNSTDATPAKTASSAPAPTPTALSAADQGAAQLTCFSWTTYDKAQKSGRTDIDSFAITAQQSAADMTDSRWSAVARMPAAEAMKTLGGLCRGIGYKEPVG